MSSNDSDDATAGRRKSGRQRKPVQRLDPTTRPKRSKAPPAPTSDNERSPEPEDPEEEEQDEVDEISEEEEEDDDDFSEDEAPKKKGRAAKGKAGAKKAAPKKAAPRKRAAKKAVVDGEEEEEHIGGTGDTLVAEDNAIYNAVRNPNSSLQTVVDDWIESYQSDAGPAMAELVNFVLRSCGCNATIDEHQAEDENGIVDRLDEIQDEFKSATNLAYPLISRSKPLKKFRPSLTTFLSLLLSSSASSEILYDDTFCQTLQSWLTSLSSSKLRAFRHTATVVALSTVSALTEVAVAVNKEFAMANRAKEAEEKKGRKDKARLKDLTRNAEEVHERKTKLEAYLDELFEGVFVHRYRDSESLIRAECIKALGGWMKVHPDYYLEGNYLRYIGWVLSDDHKDVRHAAIKALIPVYAKDSYIGQVQHFTDRFKLQLVKMARGEVDLAVRISALLVLRSIDKHGLLEEEQRDAVARLVFEGEKRVRVAVAGFFAGMMREKIEEMETEANARGGVKEWGELKVLAEMLVELGRELDGEEQEEEEGEKEEELEVVKTHRGRVALAVKALWDEVEVVRDWKKVLEFLLLDHSATEGAAKKGKKGRKGELDEATRLTEEEETLLVEVLVASLGLTTGTTATTKKEKEKDDEVQAEVSRAIIEALPRLFAKHQTVPTRVVDILSIPRLISLHHYLDLQRITAYEGLWEDVTKQFLQHSDADVIDQAVKTIRFFLSTTVLGQTNSTKFAELEDRLVESLREAVAGKDVESSAFEEDELLALSSWVARIDNLNSALDVSAALDETDEGKHSSAWEIIDSLAERGRLGYKDEEVMVQHALTILGSHLSWRMRKIASEFEDGLDEAELKAIVERRATLLYKLEEFSVGTNSNAAEGVKQAALVVLLNLHMFSAALTTPERDPNGRLADLHLECSDELQARCAGFIEAEIERYGEALAELTAGEVEEGSDTEMEEDSDDEGAKKKRKGKKAKAKKDKTPKKKAALSVRAANAKKFAVLVADQAFQRTIAPFVTALHVGIIDIRHASVILIHYDRFGAAFDQWARLLVQDLRDEGIYSNNATVVAQIVTESLQGAFDLYLDSTDTSEERVAALSRALVNAVIVRGAHLAIVKSMPTEEHVRIHLDGVEYIVTKLKAYDQAKRKESRNKAVSYFKALSNLVIGVDGKGALKIKTALDSLLEENELDIPPAAKAWEPLRGYQKRLVTAMSKDPSIKVAAKEKVKRVAAAKSGAAAASDDDQVHDSDAGTPAPVPKSRPRARKLARSTAPAQGEASDEDEVLPARPKARSKRATAPPKAKAAKKLRLEREPMSDLEDDEEPAAEEEEDDDEVESLLLPSSQPRSQGTKRQISDAEEEEQEEEQEDQEDQEEEQEEKMQAPKTPTKAKAVSRPPDSATSTQSLSDIRKKKKARR